MDHLTHPHRAFLITFRMVCGATPYLFARCLLPSLFRKTTAFRIFFTISGFNLLIVLLY